MRKKNAVKKAVFKQKWDVLAYLRLTDCTEYALASGSIEQII